MRKHILIILLALPLLQYCANQTQPTGGPQDEEPPKLQFSQPENGTVNYTDKEIRLTFDEDLQIRNAKTQILITPRITVDYDIRVRRNEVIMEFDSLLDANTTYTINFRESIQDITEGNPAEKLQLAFSTGPQLDSLFIEGNVFNMQSGNIPEEATVVLYKANDTTDIFTDLPYYFTQTSDSGKFKLNNIKAGSYRLYAFNDYNNNLKAESSKEPYGYLTDTLNLEESISSVTIPLVNLDIGEFRNLSSRASGPIYISRYNKSVDSFSYFSEDSLILQLNPTDPTTIEYYPPFTRSLTDSIKSILTVRDSINQQVSDTLYVRFDASSFRGAEYDVRAEIPPVIVRKPTLTADLIFNKPTHLNNKDSLFIQLDSALFIPTDSLRYTWNTNQTRLHLEYTFADSLFKSSPASSSEENATSRQSPAFRPLIYLGTAAFRSAMLDTLDSRKYNLTFTQDRGLSRLILRLQTTEENFIVELLSGDKAYRTVRNPDTDVIYFNDLQPGAYQLRVIIDTNNNGKWDPGYIRTLQPPERIIYYIPETGQREMELRANFDWDETFSF